MAMRLARRSLQPARVSFWQACSCSLGWADDGKSPFNSDKVWKVVMDDQTRSLGMTALWVLHGASLAGLLRSHGERGHADNLDFALQAVSHILGKEIGEAVWREAVDWASDQIGIDGHALRTSTRH